MVWWIGEDRMIRRRKFSQFSLKSFRDAKQAINKYVLHHIDSSNLSK
jgi:hypothetical protein